MHKKEIEDLKIMLLMSENGFYMTLYLLQGMTVLLQTGSRGLVAWL